MKVSRFAALALAFCITPAVVTGEPIDLPREWLPKLQVARASVVPLMPWWNELDVLRGNNDAILTETSRITGAFGIGDHWTATDYHHAARLAEQAGVPLVLTTLPWNRVGVPFCTIPPTVDDTLAETQFVLDKLTFIRDLNLGPPIVGVIIGTECQIGTEARNVIYGLIQGIFVDVQPFTSVEIVWYRNGDWSEAKGADSMSRIVQLYSPQSVEQTEQRLATMVEEFPGERYGAFITVGPCYVGKTWHWQCPEMTLDEWSWFRRWLLATEELEVLVVYPAPGHPQTDIDAFIAFVGGEPEGG